MQVGRFAEGRKHSALHLFLNCICPKKQIVVLVIHYVLMLATDTVFEKVKLPLLVDEKGEFIVIELLFSYIILRL